LMQISQLNRGIHPSTLNALPLICTT
jgi:hypothetical protein